jgi:phosphonate transport system substrate-binding protein
MVKLLKLTSIQSSSADFICRRITQHLANQLGICTEFVGDIPWQERERLLDEGEIHVGWICGLPYVWKADRDPAPVQLLAAPVMQHPRYQKRPIYFSDVVVRRDSQWHTFEDLRGASWAYNEPHSQSGYNVTRYHLATLGERSGYFGQVKAAGSHLRALEMVLTRRVDASAIDSTVLELELAQRPDLKEQVRVIETLGPSPIPPWVVTNSLAPDIRETVRRIFLQMHEDPEAQPVLAEGQIDRFVQVEDRDYDAIREMARKAEQVAW